jgi:hypothetical protein
MIAAHHGSEILIAFNTPPAGNDIMLDAAQEQVVMNYTPTRVGSI